MDERLSRTVASLKSLEQLKQLEDNARRQNSLSTELSIALDRRAGDLGREYVIEKTGLDPARLSTLEERILTAAGTYAAQLRRNGKVPSRTINQIRDRGLVAAAEASVSHKATTKGFQTLDGVAHTALTYEQTVVDYPDDFSARAVWFSRQALGLENTARNPPPPFDNSKTEAQTQALITWLKTRALANSGFIPEYTNEEAAAAIGFPDLQRSGRAYGNIQSRVDFACFACGLPPLGLTASRPFPNAWVREDRTWEYPTEPMTERARAHEWTERNFSAISIAASSLPAKAHLIWKEEIEEREEDVKAWAYGDTTAPHRSASRPSSDAPYWVFVCNPKKWAIDKFLRTGITQDTWGVRKSDRDRVAPGQLAIVRVGLDRRNAAEREDAPPLQPGIYALCEIESQAYEAEGAADGFWSPGEERAADWPTVKVRYLENWLHSPLLIETIRDHLPGVSRHVLKGLQASSFPISRDDFRSITALLGKELDELSASPDLNPRNTTELAELEKRYVNASPEVKESISRKVERGPIGALAKKLTGYKCQVCEALGHSPFSFAKPDGTPYVEAHHVMPVSLGVRGTLGFSNIMTLCANHHRQMHYGDVSAQITERSFEISLSGTSASIPRIVFEAAET